MPAIRQNRAKLMPTASRAPATAAVIADLLAGASGDVLNFFMVLLPFGFDTPSLLLKGSNATHQPNFNIDRDIPERIWGAVYLLVFI